jgi:hypothetical protein
MKFKMLALMTTLLVFIIKNEAAAQKKWYFGLEGGGKISFMAYDFARIGGLATQGGFVFGLNKPNSKWYLESGVIVGRHAMSYRREFPEDGYLGSAYDSPFRFQVFEVPVHVGYIFKAKGRSKISVFGGPRGMFFPYRPYVVSSPWEENDRYWETYSRSVFILPNASNGERRYFDGEGAVTGPGLNLDLGFGHHYALTKRWTLRTSLSFSQGILEPFVNESLFITEAAKDDFGVIVPTGTNGFGVGSRGTNLAINFGLIYQ